MKNKAKISAESINKHMKKCSKLNKQGLSRCDNDLWISIRHIKNQINLTNESTFFP